jgi:hypothetical protein
MAVATKRYSGKTPWSPVKAIIYFGGKLSQFSSSKNKPSKKPARSKQQAELALLVTALSSLTVLQFMDGSISILSLELEQSRNRHFVLHLPICHICPHFSPHGEKVSPLGTAATVWPIVPGPDDG